MKRKMVILLISVILLSAIYYYISLPDYDIDNTVKAIEQEHNRINGTPTSLEMDLYYSRWHLRHGSGHLKQ